MPGRRQFHLVLAPRGRPFPHAMPLVRDPHGEFGWQTGIGKLERHPVVRDRKFCEELLRMADDLHRRPVASRARAVPDPGARVEPDVDLLSVAGDPIGNRASPVPEIDAIEAPRGAWVPVSARPESLVGEGGELRHLLRGQEPVGPYGGFPDTAAFADAPGA